MTHAQDVSRLAAVFGDQARATMLLALLASDSMPAGRLADAAGVTAQTASGHLRLMESLGLLAAKAHGRNRIYSIAHPRIVAVLNELVEVAGSLRDDDGRK